MSTKEYGPLRFLIGKWESEGFKGENRAPDPERKVENTKFRQEMTFRPIGDVENHEQLLYALKYDTKAWEEGEEEDPFHEETGYFIWDKSSEEIIKTFAIPRGITVNAAGKANEDATEFKLTATLGSNTYGICSNKFLDEEFQTISYEISFNFISESELAYNENSRLKMKGQIEIFDHTEKNILKRVS